MRPSFIQRFFARNVPEHLLLVSGSVGMMFWAGSVAWAGVRPSFLSIAWFLFLLLVAALLGFMLAGFPGMLFLGVLLDWRARRNGAPYSVGDHVMILVGPHEGRVARVYDVWAERGQVRAELGEQERREVTDVYQDVQVCRVPSSGREAGDADGVEEGVRSRLRGVRPKRSRLRGDS
jgi:hypothetical protein